MAVWHPKQKKRPRVAVLVGPTAVGKTQVALKLARCVPAEIINGDSLQVYRELNIGTAKPTLAERALVPHHLVDVVDPPEPYDAARYCREGRAAVADIQGRGLAPLIVGGTGLYIKALLYGMFGDGSPPGGVRHRLRQELTDLGLEPLYQRLRYLDPAVADRLSPQDTYRILRALEVICATGLPLSALHAAHRFKDCPYQVLKLGLTRPREELYQRIDQRVDAMLAAGWLTEVEGLLRRYPANLKPFKALGYRHLIAFLQGRWSWEEAVTLLQRDTRRYAKRQLTWFRADAAIKWFDPGQIEEMAFCLEDFLVEERDVREMPEM